ncbi:MAG: HAD family hydrolase [Wujia sp.]
MDTIKHNVVQSYNVYDQIASVLYGKQGAIFDMDGTMLDSMDMWETLDIQYMNSLGIDPGPDFHRTVSKMTLPMASEYICGQYNVPYTPEEVAAQFTELIDGYYRYRLPVKKKIPELVKTMHDHGIRMAVATANEYEMSKIALERNHIMKYMSGLVTCTQAGAGKESPAVYLKACEILRVQVENCVIFEDSLYAVQTAKQAGFAVIGVYDSAEKENWDKICEITDGQVVLDE